MASHTDLDLLGAPRTLRYQSRVDSALAGRGAAKDVTALGKWGNGDVEIALSKAADLPYALGLARQSIEKQVGNGEAGA